MSEVKEESSFGDDASSHPTEYQKPFQMINDVLNRIPIHVLLLIGSVIVTIGTCTHYILHQLTWTPIGFSLDDSWIHLEYARSIFEGRAWEYSPGTPSSGSTSPLWSIILSPIFLFTSDIPSIVWGVIIISVIFYILCTFIIGAFFQSLLQSKIVSFFSMLGFVLIQSNTWLMLSGMEYPILMFLLLQPLWMLDKPDHKFDILLGIVAGLAYLARPEGVLLALIVFPIRLLQHVNERDFTKKRFASMTLMVVSAGLAVLPWVLHCLTVSGYPLPDTFYVKVGSVSDTDVEAWNIFWTFFLSTMPFLLIGFVIGSLTLAIKKPYAWLMGIALTLLYRYTMPYQALINNSRYLIPIFGFLAISCIAGFIVAFKLIADRSPKADPRIIPTAVTLLIIIVMIIPSVPYYQHQANVHRQAVKNINEMQVEIGYWIRENTPSDAILAIGDVGAIRFVGDRRTIDLVGLTTPDIAHGNFTGAQLMDYLRNMSTDYLIIFGKWTGYFYSYLGSKLEMLYRIQLDDNLICGDSVMIVFEIDWDAS
ncbi:MAG: hypothetical protein ACFFEJ_04810 [Candidatus Thorarchaeota archaeon]